MRHVEMRTSLFAIHLASLLHRKNPLHSTTVYYHTILSNDTVGIERDSGISLVLSLLAPVGFSKVSECLEQI